jgi:hypothetical protein
MVNKRKNLHACVWELLPNSLEMFGKNNAPRNIYVQTLKNYPNTCMFSNSNDIKEKVVEIKRLVFQLLKEKERYRGLK